MISQRKNWESTVILHYYCQYVIKMIFFYSQICCGWPQKCSQVLVQRLLEKVTGGNGSLKQKSMKKRKITNKTDNVAPPEWYISLKKREERGINHTIRLTSTIHLSFITHWRWRWRKNIKTTDTQTSTKTNNTCKQCVLIHIFKTL